MSAWSNSSKTLSEQLKSGSRIQADDANNKESCAVFFNVALTQKQQQEQQKQVFFNKAEQEIRQAEIEYEVLSSVVVAQQYDNNLKLAKTVLQVAPPTDPLRVAIEIDGQRGIDKRDRDGGHNDHKQPRRFKSYRR